MFWLQTAIFTILVLCLSWWVGKRRRYPNAGLILPICITLFGLILLISSFFIGRWEGIALSISSVSIILASMICLIIVTGIQFFKKR
ncbi:MULTISPECIES: YesK-like family protein [Bacillus]|uniref:YesK-like family protein n=1 Tax=Bacillus TaxID=1386 RepID=UPI0021133761|nr:MULTISPECIES: YesK-like family protein [Bacillus]MED1750757.1 YesK-like family protein [Bacillus zhangzhouensis]UUD43244.1 YesK-like family protein [Bacillus pumilus]